MSYLRLSQFPPTNSSTEHTVRHFPVTLSHFAGLAQVGIQADPDTACDGVKVQFLSSSTDTAPTAMSLL